jgi:hypothetical protein
MQSTEHLEIKNEPISHSAHNNDRGSIPVSSHGGLEDILDVLWTAIVKPVLQWLGYMV